MIYKKDDLYLLLRGYELDTNNLKVMGDDLKRKIQERNRNMREMEKFEKYLSTQGKKISPPENEYYKNLIATKQEVVDKALLDFIVYDGGKLFSEIMNEYKRDKTLLPIQIAGTFYNAKDEVVFQGEDDLIEFPDCTTEEEVFSKVKKAYLDVMDKVVPLPAEKVSVSLIKSVGVSLDKGTWTPFMDGVLLKVGEEQSISLAKKGRSPMDRKMELIQNALENVSQELDLSLDDLLVLELCDSLREAGNNIVSLKTIARIGRKEGGRIAEKTEDDIRKSILRLMSVVRITSKDEVEHYKMKGVSQTYYGMILPCEFVTAEINGQLVDGAIKFLGESILCRMARLKGQYTTFPVSLLSAGGSRTQGTDRLTTYLMLRIGAMKPGKNGKGKPLTIRTIRVQTLLKETIKEEEKRKDRKVKSRQLQKVESILRHCQEEGIIYSFTMNYQDKEEEDETKQKIIIAMDQEQDKEMWEGVWKEKGIKPQSKR